MNRALGPESVLFLRHLDGDWVVGWGGFRRQAEAPVDRPAFYLPDFFTIDPEPWWVPERCDRLDQASLLTIFPELNAVAERQTTRTWSTPNFAEFSADFERIQDAISESGLIKAVPFVMTSSPGTPDSQERLRLWASTLKIPSRWLAYGGWWGDEGMIGLSPEILFFSQPGWTETMALAGTALAEDSSSLLSSPKDSFEHQVVAEDIRQRLGQWGEVKSTPMYEWRVGRLKHLRTDLALDKEISFKDLVHALHPTPALGTAPRDRLSWFQQFPSQARRRRFGAPFGVNWPGEFALCCVAIRGVQWFEGQTYLASGCGVVRDSQLDHEWRELEVKRQVVQEQLGL